MTTISLQPEDELEVVFEADPVAEFVQQQLVQAGFTLENAWLLATCGADWHEAVRMIRSGADEPLVLRILT